MRAHRCLEADIRISLGYLSAYRLIALSGLLSPQSMMHPIKSSWMQLVKVTWYEWQNQSLNLFQDYQNTTGPEGFVGDFSLSSHSLYKSPTSISQSANLMSVTQTFTITNREHFWLDENASASLSTILCCLQSTGLSQRRVISQDTYFSDM